MRNEVKDKRGLTIGVHDSEVGGFVEWCKPGCSPRGDTVLINAPPAPSKVILDWERTVFERFGHAWRDIPADKFSEAWFLAIAGKQVVKPKAQFIHDDDIDTKHEMTVCVNCAKCCEEYKRSGFSGSMREFARLEIGWTKKGFQVWCVRHNCNVNNVTVRVAGQD